jgi:hypothetical protein
VSNLKKTYEKPDIEITAFEVEDITCSSSVPGASWGVY